MSDLYDTARGIAQTARHHPEGLVDIADEVRWLGRAVESLGSLRLVRLERLSDDSEAWHITFELNDPTELLRLLRTDVI